MGLMIHASRENFQVADDKPGVGGCRMGRHHDVAGFVVLLGG